MAERVFSLPDLGEGLEEAVVSAWLVAEGDPVELNQPFVEIETAKATVEVPSPYAGRVAKLHASAGETLRVGSPLVTFEVEAAAGGPPGATVLPSATPAVRKLARDLGVDLSAVRGTGPGGRVTREDVEAAAGSREGARSAAPESTEYELVPITPVRRAIAENLTQTARIPAVTTFRTVDCTHLEKVRLELGTSPLPLFVRALAGVCAEHRWLNASWSEDGIRLHRRVHTGIATDTDRGLLVPVLRDAGSLGIGEIAAEIARLADAARSGSVSREELSGATIAVTNTGSYGSEFGTPLLNPGHAVTVALGVIGPHPLVVDGRVQARPACILSLTFDHRVLDGATAGRAFGALAELLESRERLDALPR